MRQERTVQASIFDTGCWSDHATSIKALVPDPAGFQIRASPRRPAGVDTEVSFERRQGAAGRNIEDGQPRAPLLAWWSVLRHARSGFEFTVTDSLPVSPLSGIDGAFGGMMIFGGARGGRAARMASSRSRTPRGISCGTVPKPSCGYVRRYRGYFNVGRPALSLVLRPAGG